MTQSIPLDEDLIAAIARLESVVGVLEGAAREVPETAEGRDDTGMIAIVVRNTGSIADLPIDYRWRDDLDPAELGSALTAAIGDARSTARRCRHDHPASPVHLAQPARKEGITVAPKIKAVTDAIRADARLWDQQTAPAQRAAAAIQPLSLGAIDIPLAVLVKDAINDIVPLLHTLASGTGRGEAGPRRSSRRRRAQSRTRSLRPESA
ncbi:hypothetical protein [Schaalia hyovaginalis]|uniref:YbaB/EbfC family nucleoid-associated protein n=1 Tax=Schaalia hyovaginalis TaxID=29316 RepID=A0A923IW98_9ACTO|nr:hypothetical protein [Schaalia hyovaginalis]MBB6333937.1 hypothetical protein [Schaalia hyovaginalis]